MSLPVEINPGETGFRLAQDYGGGQCGPFTFEGEVFVLCHDVANATVEIWWDVAPARGENFTEADAANHPTAYSGGSDWDRRSAWVIVGATAYIAYPDTSKNLQLTPFYFGTKKWGTPITSSVVYRSHTISGVTSALSVESVPGEIIRIVHNGPLISSKDAIYYVDVDIVSGTFGAQNTLLSSGTENYGLHATLYGIGGLTHVFAARTGVSPGLIHISIGSTGTLGTEQVVASIGSSFSFTWGEGDAYFDSASGAVKLAIAYADATVLGPNRNPYRIATADSEADPSWSTDILSADPAIDQATASFGHKITVAWCYGVLYAYFAGTEVASMPGSDSDQDLYSAVNSGAGFGSAQLAHSDSSEAIEHPYVRRIDIGLGIVFDQLVAGSRKPFYTEIAINPTAAGRGGATLRRIYTGR